MSEGGAWSGHSVFDPQSGQPRGDVVGEHNTTLIVLHKE